MLHYLILKENLRQASSSELSPQSLALLQTNEAGMHREFAHLKSEKRNSSKEIEKKLSQNVPVALQISYFGLHIGSVSSDLSLAPQSSTPLHKRKIFKQMRENWQRNFNGGSHLEPAESKMVILQFLILRKKVLTANFVSLIGIIAAVVITIAQEFARNAHAVSAFPLEWRASSSIHLGAVLFICKQEQIKS